ncbi:MAG: hypothetical protein ACIAQZ_12210 [Sedimentisphaeraceae bacterium JB056]
MVRVFILVALSFFSTCNLFAQESESYSQADIESKRLYLLGFSGILGTSNHSYIDSFEVADLKNPFSIEKVKKNLDQW